MIKSADPQHPTSTLKIEIKIETEVENIAENEHNGFLTFEQIDSCLIYD